MSSATLDRRIHKLEINSRQRRSQALPRAASEGVARRRLGARDRDGGGGARRSLRRDSLTWSG